LTSKSSKDSNKRSNNRSDRSGCGNHDCNNFISGHGVISSIRGAECEDPKSRVAGQVLGLGVLSFYPRWGGIRHTPAPHSRANIPPCKFPGSLLRKRPMQSFGKLGCRLLRTAREVSGERFQMRTVAAARIPTKRQQERKGRRQRGGVS